MSAFSPWARVSLFCSSWLQEDWYTRSVSGGITYNLDARITALRVFSHFMLELGRGGGQRVEAFEVGIWAFLWRTGTFWASIYGTHITSQLGHTVRETMAFATASVLL